MSEKIVVTETLKVEIFYMAVIDLSIRFCYRFVEPVPMIWQNDGRMGHALIMAVDKNNIMSGFLLNKYKEAIFNTKNIVNNEEDWAKIQWLEKVNKVEMVECDLVPRSK